MGHNRFVTTFVCFAGFALAFALFSASLLNASPPATAHAGHGAGVQDDAHLHAMSAQGQHTITVAAGFRFSPSVITVTVGDTVNWTGLASFHTISSSNGLLDSPDGATAYTMTFSQTGVFAFFCEPHQFFNMTGEIRVVDALGNLPTPTPQPGATPAGPGAPVTKVLSATKDNTLFSETSIDGAQESNGSGNAIYVGRTGSSNQGSVRRGLVSFDLSTVPQGATILSATVRMSSLRDVNGARVIALHRALAQWGEGSSVSSGGTGALAQPDDATWLHRFYSSTLWTTAGGDFAAAASTSATVALTGTYTWPSTPQTVADVQAWVNSPGSNAGWLVMGDESTLQTAKQLASREHSESALRPVLELTYLTPVNPCSRLSMTFGPETTATVTSASGYGTFQLDTISNTLEYTIVYTGLSSVETNAHFHAFVPPAVSGPPIAGQPLSANGSPKTGVWAYGSDAIEAQLLAGQVYVNIHTANYTAGEIRGNLIPCSQTRLPLVMR